MHIHADGHFCPYCVKSFDVMFYESVIGGIKTVSYGPSIGTHKNISLQSSFLNFLHSIMMNLKNLYAIGCISVAIFISWNFRINI